MSLLELPNELLEAIAQNLISARDLNCFIRAHPRLHGLLVTRLYHQEDERGGAALRWAVLTGRIETLRRAKASGLDIHHPDLLRDAVVHGKMVVLEILLPDGAAYVNHIYDSDLDETLLGMAVQDGRRDMAKLLLDHGAEVDARTSNGLTPLHIALKKGFASMADLLLERGANPSTTTEDDRTTLHFACEAGLTEIAIALMDRGANVSAVSKRGLTPLHSAMGVGSPELVQGLLDRGADPCARIDGGGTPLHISAACGNYEVSNLLIERGAKASALDKDGISPLDTAIKSGHVPIVELLLRQEDVDVKGLEAGGLSALHMAATSGSTEVVRLLIDRGSDVAAQSESGLSPLYLACENGSVPAMRILIDAGAPVESKVENGRTPLHAACKQQTPDAAELLVKHGADISVEDKDGYTPLHLASQFGCTGTVQLLLESGADPTGVMRGPGWTPLHTAARGGIRGMVCVLAPYYASDEDINRQDSAGRTPLFFAARCGNLEDVRVLLARNARSDVKDYLGADALVAASRAGQQQAAELLLQTDQGECIRRMDGTGHTAVWWASRSGDEDLFNLFRQHAKNTGVKIMRRDVITEDDLYNTLPSFEPGFCFCDICTLSIPWANWSRVCTVCYGGMFLICDDCFEEGLPCMDVLHRSSAWEYPEDACDCKNHYPHTGHFIPNPEVHPDQRRHFVSN